MLISFSFNKLLIWFIELVISDLIKVLKENCSPDVAVSCLTSKL